MLEKEKADVRGNASQGKREMGSEQVGDSIPRYTTACQPTTEKLNELEAAWAAAPLGSDARMDAAIAYVDLFPVVYPQYCRPAGQGGAQ